MSGRIIIEQPPRVFRAIEPAAELDYSQQIMRCAEKLFPGYVARLWAPIIRDWQGRGAQPDMVLISANGDSWYVVEVELASHSVNGHISPQLETLSQGIYDDALVSSLARAYPEVPLDLLRRVVYKEPGLLCIVNSYVDSIHTACRTHHFEMAVVEPFYCELGEWALSVRQMPSIFKGISDVGSYQLRRVKAWGDRIFLELPGHFPYWQGVVEVRESHGEPRKCQILLGSPRCLIVPAAMVPRDSPMRAVIIDPLRQIIRLEAV